MANALYTKGKERMLSGTVNFVSDSIKVAVVTSAYSPSLTTDEFLADLGANTIGSAQSLGGKTIAGGALDATDVTWAAVVAGSTAKGVVIYKDTGTPETSPLLVYIDTITGWPLLTNGGDITVQWDNGAYKIFSL